MSKTRAERMLGQAERVRAVFDEHPGGVPRALLAALAAIPETAVSRVMAHLRNHALDYGHTAKALKITDQWIYGWAEVIHEHIEEHIKRCRNEGRSLKLSIETTAQSLVEHPESIALRQRLHNLKHRLDDVELEIEMLTGQLRVVGREIDAT